MNYKITIHGVEYEVNIHKVEGTAAHLTVNDVEFEVQIEGLATNPTRMSREPEPILPNTPVVKPKVSTSAYGLKSPLPGVIIDICVKEGDTVKPGQVLLILEAMKMENNIEADREGVIERIERNKGDSVLEGDVILVIK
jgi:biotin carboxyl carrier protein